MSPSTKLIAMSEIIITKMSSRAERRNLALSSFATKFAAAAITIIVSSPWAGGFAVLAAIRTYGGTTAMNAAMSKPMQMERRVGKCSSSSRVVSRCSPPSALPPGRKALR